MADNNDIQVADALSKIHNKMGAKDTNKIVYKIRVEDPTSRPKSREFLAYNMLENPYYLEIRGVDLTQSLQTHNNLEINSYRDIIDLKEKGLVEIINIRFPWTRIVNIQNMSFKKEIV